MNNKLKAFSLALCALASGYNAYADEDTTSTLAIEFHTTVYDEYGDTNAISVVLGSTSAGVGTYIDVDCGDGKLNEYQLSLAGYDEENEASTGTFITLNVAASGTVKIYCDDPSVIDWIDASGCYIDKITISDEVSNLVYLSLSHNELLSLDLTKFTSLQALYITDNPFTNSPLVIGPKAYLQYLEMNNIGSISSDFDINQFPNLLTLDAWNAKGLTRLTPSGCPNLLKLSIDGTDVSSLDVSQNQYLQVLNISDTRITEIDVTHNPNLYQLYCTHESSINSEYKIKSLDVSQNPALYYLFCTGNDLTELDVTKNINLGSLTARKNLLTTIDVSNNTGLFCLNISDNNFGYSTLPWPTTSAEDGEEELYTEYDYAQRDIAVEKSYAVGTVLDFSEKMLRDHTDTEAVLYTIDEANPTDPILLSEDYYSYDIPTAKFTIKKEYADSVYISFSNSKFTAADLKTQMFKIKSAEEYGKPTKVASFATEARVGGNVSNISFNVGIDGATKENPKTFYVDFGSGTYTAFTATTSDATENNVNSAPTGTGIISIYVPDGVEISALSIKDFTLYNADLSNLRSLRELSLTNTGIYTVDLQWNRCLQSIDLSNNEISTFTLVGNNQGYGKNALTDVNLSHNKISTFEWNENYTVKNFDISYNKLSELNLTGNTTIESINIAYNDFSTFSCADCTSLTTLNVEGNQLSSITVPEENVITKLNVSNNKFSLATLPDHSKIAEEDYTYAPQANYTIPTKAPGINLKDQNVNGNTTYTWRFAEDDSKVSSAYYYAQNAGQFRFAANKAGAKIYCEMTNTDFPDFSGENVYRTTVVETADMPNYVVAEFTVEPREEDESTDLNYDTYFTLQSTSAVSENAIYVDWKGDGSLSQYQFGSKSYTTYYPEVTEGAHVTIYSYEEEDNIFVFSMRNIKMSSFKLGSEKSLGKVYCLNLTNAGLEEIELPKSSVLNELILPGNNLTTFDFSRYPSVTYLNLSDNKLSTADLSDLSNVQQLFLGGNGLETATFGTSERLWNLFLNDNELTTVDLSPLKNLNQVHVNGNKLTDINVANNTNLSVLYANDNQLDHIDVSNLKNLGVLELSGNKFKFSTLPLESDVFGSRTIYTYEYSKQASLPIESVNGVVDLSGEANINGTATTYVWCLGEPDFDDGYLTNELLYSQDDNTEEDPDFEPDYTIENGVTKFVYDFSSSEQALACVLTNDLFPNLTLQTTMVKPTAYDAGVNNVVVDSANASVKVDGNSVYAYCDNGGVATIYGVNGAVVASANVVNGVATFNNVAKGFYLVKVGTVAVKIVVK